MKITRFEDILAWQKARVLTRLVYAAAGKGGFTRDLPLRSEITAAAGSMMHNIAEGFDSGSRVEFRRFLRYAQRSASEVKSQLCVALDQSYLKQQEFDQLYDLADKGYRLIGGFIKSLLKTPAVPTRH
jgi:four helix bundle protein